MSYIIYLLIAVIPSVCVVLTTDRGEDPPTSENEWVFALWSGAHLIFVNPAMTLLAFSAVSCQAPKVRKGVPPPPALSLRGLAIQAGVFSVLALTWPFRFVNIDPDWDILRRGLRCIAGIYLLVGRLWIVRSLRSFRGFCCGWLAEI